ncbi:hypothetical protein PAPYR_12327 [Paratrimastix pyriformis]|uniref:Uncharacterized protein n=1 Tax=Paratrimastix pyriformis TaxID=342808 RepID=A0ABQ8U5Z0_9EUKA|nr:hypothetical protein PAPYR_12327 [Paratrimastix pyriformis]
MSTLPGGEHYFPQSRCSQTLTTAKTPTDEPIHQILNRFHRHIDEKLGLARPLTVQLQIIEHEVDVITALDPGADDYHQNE